MGREPEIHCRYCDEKVTASSIGGNLRRCPRCGSVLPTQTRKIRDNRYRDHDVLPVDRYRLITPLRQKGPGRVYLARHLVLDEPCVVKILSRVDPGYSEEARERFVREAKAGFRIRHANVASVLDCDRKGDEWYFVMEHVEGIDLGSVLRSTGRLPWGQAARIAIDAANGLSAVHEQGLLHRDIKPSNLILCEDGSVKIADLGLVQFLSATTDASGVGFGYGTPHYMAPEQRMQGGKLTAQSDVYSLGATLYHLLVGHPPTGGGGPLQYLVNDNSRAPVDWPADITPAIPNWLRLMVERCLLPDALDRFPSCEDMAAEVVDWLGDMSLPSRFGVQQVGTPTAYVVLPFENLSRNEDDDWLGTAIAVDVHAALLKSGAVQVVDRQELLALIGRVQLGSLGELSNTELLAAARRVGAGVVIRGSFQTSDDRILVNASRVVSSREAGKLLVRVTGSVDNVIDLQARVAHEVICALGFGGSKQVAFERPTNSRSAKLCAAGQRAFAAGRYAQAIDLAEKGLEDDPESVELLSLLGVCLNRQNRSDEAIYNHRLAAKLARANNDPFRLIEATGNLGVTYYFKGDLDHALEFFQSAVDLAGDMNLLPLLAKQLNNLGFVLSKMERLGEADTAFEEAIEIRFSLGATASMVSPYNGRGEIALRQGRVQDALEYYRKALTWAEELEDQVNIGVCHANLGRCYLKMNELELCQSHLDDAVEVLGTTEFWNGMTVAYEYHAELCMKRSQADAAFDYVDKRIDLARRHGNRHVEAAAWEQKARAFEMNAKKDEAMDCLRKSLELHQSKNTSQRLARGAKATKSNPDRS